MKIILAILLSLLLAVPAEKAVKPQEKTDFNYVVFGASQTNGYGLHGFVAEEIYDDPTILYGAMGGARDGYYSSGYYWWSDDCFPQLLAGKLQEYFGSNVTVNFQQRAINSMRAYDLDYLLNDNVKEDGYIAWRLGNGQPGTGWLYDLSRARNDSYTIKGTEYTYTKEATDLRQEFKDSVINADLIVYDLGINDFGVYLSNRISTALSNGFAEAMYDADIENLVGKDITMYNQVKKLVKDVLCEQLGVSLSEKEDANFDFLADTLAYAFIGYVKSFDDTMETIYALNPDTEVVVCSIQNLMKDYKAQINGKEIKLGELFGYVIDLANVYTAYLSPYSQYYYYADVSKDGHQEYFIDDILNWDENIDNLPEEIKEAFDCYEKDLQVRSVVTPQATAFIGKYYGLLHDTILLSDTEINGLLNYLIDEACDGIYYTLAKSVKIAASESLVSVEGAAVAKDTVNAVVDLITNSQNGVLAKIASPFVSSVLAVVNKKESKVKGFESDIQEYIDTQLSLILATPEARSGYMIGMVSSFANCFFYHPNVKGHADMAELVFQAYLAKNSERRKAYTSINEYITAVITTEAQKAADKALELMQETAETIAETVPVVVDEVIETITEVAPKVKEEIVIISEEVAQEIAEVPQVATNAAEEFDEKVDETIEDVLDSVNNSIDEFLGNIFNW